MDKLEKQRTQESNTGLRANRRCPFHCAKQFMRVILTVGNLAWPPGQLVPEMRCNTLLPYLY